MDHFFKDKVVAITGGSNGIGRALIDTLLPLGAKVATCSRQQDKMYNLQKQYSNYMIHAVVADVSRLADCKYFIESTIKTFGGIDILINNAGISMRALLKDVDIEVVEKVMDINFFGTAYCSKLALNAIVERKGTIVGVSSIAGYRGLPGRTGYSASKFAIIGFLETLRTELMDSGVNVMWVNPGFTSSNIRNTALNDKGQEQGESPMDESKMMSAADCASKILHAIVKKRRTLIFSIMDKRTVLLNWFFPSLMDKLVRNYYFKNGKLVK